MDTSTSIIKITAQQKRLGRYIARYRAQNDQLVHWRVWTFLGGFIACLVALAISNIALFIVFCLWMVGFTVLVRGHRQLRDTLTRFQIAHHLRGEQLARLKLTWGDLPPSIASAPSDHPFATDIDLIGEYSLHRLLDNTVTRGGSDKLASWLLRTSPDKAHISRVQGLVTELRPLTTFRQQISMEAHLIGVGRGGWRASVGRKWEGTRLSLWLSQSHPTISAGLVMLLALNALLTAVLFIIGTIITAPPIWLISFVLYAILSFWQFRKIGNLFGEALALYAELGQLRAMLRHLETFKFSHQRGLKGLCAPFQQAERPPSAHLHRLDVILGAVSLQANPILWMMVNLLIPYDIFWGYMLGKSKGDLTAQLPVWLEAIYELETLSALSEFSALHPQHPFPSITDAPQMVAKNIGHPHIPHDVRVDNDFAFTQLGEMVIITGSNMAGKSSFLRTLGVNLVLAYAGSVVCAEKLDVGMFRLFSCIRVNDSVVDGISYFYAEVRRLKALLNALQTKNDMPLFFLIDEIFRGTNNRERLIGSKAYIQALAHGHGVGLISTHDLDLVQLADEIPSIRNHHFREHIENGVMVFDYVLREGPCPTTNALMIMHLEGLPVPAP
ncbi:MAG: hypothetical protein SH821_04010 [Phototrophicales bacterium]|nr:hypothetical protein [Phototrophicales bacterium]